MENQPRNKGKQDCDQELTGTHSQTRSTINQVDEPKKSEVEYPFMGSCDKNLRPRIDVDKVHINVLSGLMLPSRIWYHVIEERAANRELTIESMFKIIPVVKMQNFHSPYR